MDTINSIEKALEYLVKNPNGNLRELRNKVDVKQIVNIRDSNFLRFDKENNYEFTQEGIDYYSKVYGRFLKTNFLGL